MNTLLNDIQDRLDRVNKLISSLQGYLDKAPEGSLNIDLRQNRISYYNRKQNINNKNKREYIHDSDKNLAVALATKDYYIRILPYLEKERNALQYFLKHYSPESKYKIYDSLCEPRKSLVTPIISREAQLWKKWCEDDYEQYVGFSDNLKFETARHEMVRSKSEVIIADTLNRFRDDLDYRYEKPLWLPEQGKLIYPDFTIFIRTSGKLFYWEHAGMMSDPFYANDFIQKYNWYNLNGIMPGRDLILTFESAEAPLNTSVVNKIIHQILLC